MLRIHSCIIDATVDEIRAKSVHDLNRIDCDLARSPSQIIDRINKAVAEAY